MNLTTLSVKALLEYSAELGSLSKRPSSLRMRSSYLACQLEIKRRAGEARVYSAPNLPSYCPYLFGAIKLLKSLHFSLFNRVKNQVRQYLTTVNFFKIIFARVILKKYS